MSTWQPIDTLDPEVKLFLIKEADGDVWLVEREIAHNDGRFYAKENGCGCCSTLITAVSWCPVS